MRCRPEVRFEGKTASFGRKLAAAPLLRQLLAGNKSKFRLKTNIFKIFIV
jgi:hypothetical protein